ncbi:MAG: rhamnose ABC transporter substrate-binding protein [Treponema sp.]|jgi:rhamnose transport system substrate-binding protein|nr:rhamnose ABC transporter substrate-binding protein [Treponema sp.]
MNKMKRVLPFLMAAVLVSMVLSGCAPKTDAAGGASNTHAVVFKSTGNPFGEKLMDGFEAAIKEQGGTVIRRAPDLPTAEAQIQIIEQLIAQKVASITISANDYDALQPVLTNAKAANIKIVTADSSVNPASRSVHINQADTKLIGETLVEAAFDQAGGSGDIAILSATSQASNQNAWIAVMEETLKQPKYANLNLVKIAYGDDLRDKSLSETEGLLASYANLKVIVAPTTVGIAAAAKVITDRNLIGTVKITGLGLPSEMAEYITNGSCPYMFLWNPIDLGYLGGYAALALAGDKITGGVGDQFDGGKLGSYTVVNASDGGTEVILGPPFKFEPSNINEWKDVY